MQLPQTSVMLTVKKKIQVKLDLSLFMALVAKSFICSICEYMGRAQVVWCLTSGAEPGPGPPFVCPCWLGKLLPNCWL